jgi:hypothetical protein
MVTGKQRHGAGWLYLLDAAVSQNADARRIALIRAYAWVEHALDAADVAGPRKPIARRILNTFDQPHLSQGLSEDTVRSAISARNAVSHDDAPPDRAACLSAVKTLRDIWHALSRHFVTERTALDLAKAISRCRNVLSVCLYGSFARGTAEPNYLDFLLLDDGTYSETIDLGHYDDGSFDAVRITKEVLAALKVSTPKLERCAECRWLDVGILDGHLFGVDGDYTIKVRRAQPDPWFFLNISRDIKEFAPPLDRFARISRSPFKELKTLGTELERIGFA